MKRFSGIVRTYASQVAFLMILQLANKLAAFTVAIAVPTFNVFKNASVVAATLDTKLLQNLMS